MNFIGFNLLLRSYMKYVYNRPYEPNIDIIQKRKQDFIRNRNLGVFLFLGAPLTLFNLNKSAISYKEMGSINFFIPNSTELETTNNSSNIINKNSSLFLILSNLKKKIPNWVKLFFKLNFLTLLVLKLLGFNSLLDVLININYLKIFTYISCSLAIIYQIFNLYLLHIFSLKSIKISEVLPEFLINWLKEFEELSTSKETIKEFKKTCYIEIIIYILIIIILTIIV
uniref:hypothetical protein n=1 Tax=Squamanita imbachii TaxID=2976389 RepID=UPI0030DE56CE